MSQIDFKSINERLLAHAPTVVSDIAPGGKRVGQEYRAATIQGGDGKSFSVNLTTGAWADFATGDKGGDLISLYAKSRGINNGQAATELQTKYLGTIQKSYPEVPKKESPRIIKPPLNTNPPGFKHYKYGEAVQTWCYRDFDGQPLFYVARYNTSDNKKEFIPYTFQESGKWINKAWPNPRPLYNLDKINANPNAPILIVEGEKSAEAAEQLVQGRYIVTTWPNGSNGYMQADFTPIYGRKVLCWPDADAAGAKCMGAISARLVDHCAQVKYLEISQAYNNGWDAADALQDPEITNNFIKWAKQYVQEVKRALVSDAPVTIEQEDEVKLPTNLALLYVHLNLDMNETNTKVVMNTENVLRILQTMPEFKSSIWRDSFDGFKYTTLFSDAPKMWEDVFDLHVMSIMVDKYKLVKITKSQVIDAVNRYASLNTRNSAQDWINSLSWDGQERITNFFHQAMGADDTEYTRAVSRNFFISMAARVLSPGCKSDAMVILEGGQGTFKSTSLEILGGKYFCEAPSNMDSKDFEQSLIGKLIVEFGELDQFRKSESTLIKKKLSCRIDTYRPSYGRETIQVPRTCIFVGTTNKDRYLQDETGARRFWPIKITVCDIEYIRANRNQLFAEAVQAYKNGETWHSVPEESKDVQEQRREVHPWEEAIQHYLTTKPTVGPLTTMKIYLEALEGKIDRLSTPDSKNIAKIMTALGYEQKFSRDISNGKTIRRWVQKGSEILTINQPADTTHRPWNYAPGADNSEHH